MTTARNWTVVANGTVSVPMTKASAERVAKRLRTGADGYAPMAAEVRSCEGAAYWRHPRDARCVEVA